ncbi:hypothetical protein NCCP1664_20970 [Zafaria cholistanensis]|uniref:Uncharacterized protein n=2 Tax=Zafaria cholistanensis TaxID=1682741 RepID=A0A5A7NTX6_9MICC|nr:hypothetical protein NCCP1664_20970 [Zafaria cholistanensis]
MLQTVGERQLWWRAQYNEDLSDWSELQSLGQLAGLVKSLAVPGDWLQVEDEEPITRYAQVMLIDAGAFHVETAACRPEGTYNWRIGYGSAADDAGNSPASGTEGMQELDTASTIEVLTSWAAGRGLPLGYGAALHMY